MSKELVFEIALDMDMPDKQLAALVEIITERPKKRALSPGKTKDSNALDGPDEIPAQA